MRYIAIMLPLLLLFAGCTANIETAPGQDSGQNNSTAENTTFENTTYELKELTAMDYFAKCLSENGLQMFGSATCGGCISQKKLFGDSFQYIDYVECQQSIPGNNFQLCKEKQISHVPAWIRDDQMIDGFQSIQKLEEFSGCTLASDQ